MSTIAFLAPEAARRLVESVAVVLDARGVVAWRRGHLPGAQRLDWKRLRAGGGRDTRITDDDARLERSLEHAGVVEGRPVLVYGDAGAGRGADGRVAWTLALCGVGEVFVLDGGFAAWRDAGLPIVREPTPAPASRFRLRRDDAVRATRAQVAAAIAGPTRLVDVRSDGEWNGARPHFEPRGGRIPGAVHYNWRRLLAGGRLRDAAAITGELAASGVARDDEIIVYCAGGLRAGFAWAALRALGFPRVRMYDGSFLDWSRAADMPVEHETQARLRPIAAGAAAGLMVAAGAWLLGRRPGRARRRLWARLPGIG